MEREELFKNYYKTHFRKIHLDIDKELKSMARYYSKFYQPFLPEDEEAKILDLGCGLGYFLYFLKMMGYKNFEGIDLASDNIKIVKEKITDKVFLEDAFEYLPKKKNFYDLIHARDVIEHIPKNKIIDFLKLIFQSLKPGGKLIIGTPNAAGLSSVSLIGRYMDFTHEILFTEWSLEQVLRIAGFQEIQIIPSELKFKDKSLKGKIAYIFLRKPEYFLRRLFLYLAGFQPLPKILHWHMMAIAKKPEK